MRRWAVLLVLAVVTLAGCGGATRTVTVTTPSPASKLKVGPSSCAPARGAGVMGACVPREAEGLRLTLGAATSRPIPDVSEFQSHPRWSSAKGQIAGAIARVADMSTGRPDFSFAYNWHELRRLHIWHAAYAFVRPGNCAAEGREAYGWVRAQGGLDSGPLIADAEVPLSFSCATDFTSAVEAASGWHVCVIYTAQGTWPGGAHGNCKLWDAAYGSRPGCVWTCLRVAWQFTDGIFGPFPHSTVLGSSDLSRDEGITRIVRAAPCGAACQRARKRAQQSALLRRERSEVATLARLRHRHNCASRPLRPRPRASYRGPCEHWNGLYVRKKRIVHDLLNRGVR